MECKKGDREIVRSFKLCFQRNLGEKLIYRHLNHFRMRSRERERFRMDVLFQIRKYDERSGSNFPRKEERRRNKRTKKTIIFHLNLKMFFFFFNRFTMWQRACMRVHMCNISFSILFSLLYFDFRLHFVADCVLC